MKFSLLRPSSWRLLWRPTKRLSRGDMAWVALDPSWTAKFENFRRNFYQHLKNDVCFISVASNNKELQVKPDCYLDERSICSVPNFPTDAGERRLQLPRHPVVGNAQCYTKRELQDTAMREILHINTSALQVIHHRTFRCKHISLLKAQVDPFHDLNSCWFR